MLLTAVSVISLPRTTFFGLAPRLFATQFNSYAVSGSGQRRDFTRATSACPPRKYAATDPDAVFLALTPYRLCKLIRDTIKMAVDIGCGSGAGGMRVRMGGAGHYGPRDGWQKRHALRLLAGEPVCRRPILLSGPRAQLVPNRDKSSFGGANAFLETGLGRRGGDLRTFGDGSGRLRQGRGARRSCDPRYRLRLCDARSCKRHLWEGSRGKGPVHTKCMDGSTTTTCRSWQTACSATAPHTCLGAWACLPF